MRTEGRKAVQPFREWTERRYRECMSISDTACVEIEGDLLARVRRVARERAIDVPQLVHEALSTRLVREPPRRARTRASRRP